MPKGVIRALRSGGKSVWENCSGKITAQNGNKCSQSWQ